MEHLAVHVPERTMEPPEAYDLVRADEVGLEQVGVATEERIDDCVTTTFRYRLTSEEGWVERAHVDSAGCLVVQVAVEVS